MSAFKFELQQVKDKINQANLEQAIEHLLSLNAQHSFELREKKHWEGKIHMRHGHFDRAIELFLEADSRWGHHVALLLDLAACYYLSGQMYLWSQTLDLAEYEFRQNRHRISPERQTFTFLLLAKFKEEQGALHEALELYEENLDRLQEFDLNLKITIQKLRIQAQILRLRSEYESTKKAMDLYTQLSRVNAKETNWDCEFEIEHALMIFESRFFGMSHAEARFQKLLQNPLLQTSEATLIYADFIYEILLADQIVPPKVIEQLSANPSLSPYERELAQLAQNPRPSQKRMLEWTEEMSLGQMLRLYILVNKLDQEANHSKAIHLFIAGLSPASKRLWSHNLQTGNKGRKSLFLNSARGTLSCAGEKLEIQLNTAGLEILTLMIGKNEFDLALLTKSLWNGNGEESDIARLRMRLKRLNTALESKWGISNFALIKGSKLILCLEILDSRTTSRLD